MLTGKIKNQVDEIWEAFWTGGIANQSRQSKPQANRSQGNNRQQNKAPAGNGAMAAAFANLKK